MENLETARQSLTTADVEHANNLLNDGASPEEVQRQLVARGCAEPAAAAVARNLRLRATYAEAVKLLNSGLAPQQAEQRLVENGVDHRVASTVILDLLQARARDVREQSSRGSAVFQFVGGIVFALGIGLFVGNVTGLFATFPFAGFLLMTIGGGIMAAGREG